LRGLLMEVPFAIGAGGGAVSEPQPFPHFHPDPQTLTIPLHPQGVLPLPSPWPCPHLLLHRPPGQPAGGGPPGAADAGGGAAGGAWGHHPHPHLWAAAAVGQDVLARAERRDQKVRAAGAGCTSKLWRWMYSSSRVLCIYF